jgi:hypothetical protein
VAREPKVLLLELAPDLESHDVAFPLACSLGVYSREGERPVGRLVVKVEFQASEFEVIRGWIDASRPLLLRRRRLRGLGGPVGHAPGISRKPDFDAREADRPEDHDSLAETLQEIDPDGNLLCLGQSCGFVRAGARDAHLLDAETGVGEQPEREFSLH